MSRMDVCMFCLVLFACFASCDVVFVGKTLIEVILNMGPQPPPVFLSQFGDWEPAPQTDCVSPGAPGPPYAAQALCDVAHG